MAKAKLTFKILLGIALAYYSIMLSYYYITNEFTPKYQDCGVVVSNGVSEIPVKRGSYTDFYLNIQFEKAGFKSIDVSRATWYSTKVNEHVCFNLPIAMPESHHIKFMGGCIILFALGIILVMGFIFWLFNIEV